MFDAELSQKLLAAVFSSLLAESCRFQDGHDVFMDGELSKYRFLLRQVAHSFACAPIHRHLRDIPILENYAAAVRPNQADDHVKRRGLAGAIGPEEADDFAAFHVDI